MTADVSANVSVWHGYDFFYPSLNLSASSPPVLKATQVKVKSSRPTALSNQTV